MYMNRREWLRVAGVAAGSGLWASVARGQDAAGAAAKRPNVVFILADDLGYGDLGCYGQKVIQTPRLDQMAAEGVRFTQAYAGSTVCAPSRCSLMTGYHCGHAWIRGNGRQSLRPEDVTIPELMKRAGYATALIGKWGLGEPDTTGSPIKKGFDYFFGYTDQGHAHNYYPDFLWRGEERVPIEGNVQSPTKKGVAVERKQYSHDLFIEEGLSWIDAHKAEPFFLYLALTIPHANNERGRAEGDGMEVPDYGLYADKAWPKPEQGRAAMITRMDRDVGRVLDRLRDLGIAENTIVFFTSDNGPHREGGSDADFNDSNGPVRGYKRDLTDGGIREPMLAWWPGTLKPGAVSEQVWAFWDVMPTLAELAGVEPPKGIDGISIVPTLKANGVKPELVEQPQHEFLYWEFHEGGFDCAVRYGDWKGIRNGLHGPLELYNIKDDIGETKDVAADHPDIVAKIEEYLKTARTENEFWVPK